MLSAILSTVAASAAIAALGAGTRVGRELMKNAFKLVRPDHQTLYAGPWPLRLPPESDCLDVRITLRAAPSRALRKPTFDVEAALRVTHEKLGFWGQVGHSGVNDGLRIDGPNRNGCRDYAWIGANGLIELSVSVGVEHDAAGQRVLEAVDLLRHLVSMASAIRSPAYAQMYGNRKYPARKAYDWLIGVSMYARGDSGQVFPAWEKLRFQAASPPRLAEEQRPFCPPDGYARKELEGWRANKSDGDLLTAFLSSYLGYNGFHRYDKAVRETVERVGQPVTTTSPL